MSPRGLRYAAEGARLVAGMLAGRPFLCNWQVTNRCDFQCSICDFWKEPDRADEELSLDGFARAARTLAPLAPLAITFAGGEPLLRPDLADIVRLFSPRHFVGIITNGWHLDRPGAERLWASGLRDARVSLDYRTPSRHDAQRGRSGAFDRAVAAVRHLTASRPSARHRVHLMTVLLDDNAGELDALCFLAAEFGVSLELTVHSDRLGSLPTRKPDRPVSALLTDLRRRHGARFVSPPDYLAGADLAIEHGQPGCRAGLTFFDVDDRGRVSRCIDRRREIAGSLLEDPLDRILDRLAEQAREVPCTACYTSCRAVGDRMTGTALLPRLPDFWRFVRPLSR